jgi:hypothetical protein
MPQHDTGNARIAEQLDRIEGRVEKIDNTIHGNGQPGLKTVVDRHEQTLGIFKRLLWGILGVVGTIAGGLALAALL